MLCNFQKFWYPHAHLEGGLGIPQLSAKKTGCDAGSGEGTGDTPAQVGMMLVKTLKCWFSNQTEERGENI